MGFELNDVDGLSEELRRLSQLRFDAVIEKNMTEIYRRGKEDGGTPVDTGELKISLSQSGDEVGYTKEYAPHVEHGHRQNVGQFVPRLGKRLKAPYVQGQKFLKANVDKQRPIFQRDLQRELRRFK